MRYAGSVWLAKFGRSSRDSSPEMSLGSRVSRRAVKVSVFFVISNIFLCNSVPRLSKYEIISSPGTVILNCFKISVLRFVKTLPLPWDINRSLISKNRLYKYMSVNFSFSGKYNQPSCMHASISRNFGSPGVALLERIRFPFFNKTVLFKPSILMNSFVDIKNLVLEAVASLIFTQGKPSARKKSCIGLGEPPLLTVTSCPNSVTDQPFGTQPNSVSSNSAGNSARISAVSGLKSALLRTF